MHVSIVRQTLWERRNSPEKFEENGDREEEFQVQGGTTVSGGTKALCMRASEERERERDEIENGDNILKPWVYHDSRRGGGGGGGSGGG